MSQQISDLWPSLWTNLETLTKKYKPTISTRSFRLQLIILEEKLLPEHYNIFLNATYNYLAPQVYSDLQVGTTVVVLPRFLFFFIFNDISLQH
jgi:hypothetical protein